MKKLIPITLLILVFTKISVAQTTPAVNNAYTTQNSSIIVYPFDPAVGKPDKKIHFLFNANTKFYISQILDSGYVVKVWSFKDEFKIKKDSKTTSKGVDQISISKKKVLVDKNVFYRFVKYSAIIKSRLARSILSHDSLMKKQVLSESKLNSDSLKAVNAKNKFLQAQKQFLNSKNNLSVKIANSISGAPIEQRTSDNIKSLLLAKSELEAKTNNFNRGFSTLYKLLPSYDSINFKLIKSGIPILRKSKTSLDSLSIELRSLNLSVSQSNLATLIDTLLAKKATLDNTADTLINSILIVAKSKQNSVSIATQILSQNKNITKSTEAISNYDSYLKTITIDFINNSPSLEDVQATVSAFNNSPQDSKGDDKYSYRIFKSSVNTSMDSTWYNSKSPAAIFDTLAFVDSWGNYMDFYLPLKNFSDCVQYYPKSNNFTWGFLSVPLKIRVAPYSFDQNVNFGLTFGWKWQRAATVNESNNVLFGVSVGSVNLTAPPNSTPPAVASIAATTTSAVSFSLGYMFQYDKFQAGGFFGWDIAGGSNRSEFVNAKTPWFGIAIGLSLFGENKTTGTAQSQ
jgi:hypothetical protein